MRDDRAISPSEPTNCGEGLEVNAAGDEDPATEIIKIAARGAST
jgi:hypothetical protein